MSKFTIHRRLHQQDYRGYTTRCKPLISLKNRKARLHVAKKQLRAPKILEQNLLDRWEKDYMYPSDGKRKVWRKVGNAHDPKHTASSVNHGCYGLGLYGCHWNGLLSIDYVTADRSTVEHWILVYRNISSAQIKPNTSKLTQKKHTARAMKCKILWLKAKIPRNKQMANATFRACSSKHSGKMPQTQNPQACG